MTNKEVSALAIFEKASFELLENGNYMFFSDTLMNILSKQLLCNCFLRQLDKAILKQLLSKSEKIQILDNDNGDVDFTYYFFKGFIHLVNNQQQEALSYLTTAINLNPSSDICYGLRSLIKKQPAIIQKEDSIKAVLLNPSSLNYFRLGNIFFNENSDECLTYYTKAIRTSNGSNACALNKKALFLFRKKEFDKAFDFFMKSYRLNPDNLYDQSFECIRKLENIPQAEYTIEVAMKQYPDNINYIFMLGMILLKQKKYKKGFQIFEYFLSKGDGTEWTKNYLENEARSVSFLFKERALSQLRGGNHKKAYLIYKYLINLFKSLGPEDTHYINYFYCLLNIRNSRFELNNTNNFYKKLEILKQESTLKRKLNLPLSIEEIEINSIEYYFSYNTISFNNNNLNLTLSIQELLDYRPSFILDSILSSISFIIPLSYMTDARLISLENYYEALEVNLIKIVLKDKWHQDELIRNYS